MPSHEQWHKIARFLAILGAIYLTSRILPAIIFGG